MNIWIFNHYAVPPDMPGGTRHFDIGKELIERKHNIVIFASDYHHNLRKYFKTEKSDLFKKEYIEGIEFFWIRTFPHFKNDWRRIINMISYGYKSVVVGLKIKGKPDVIVGSSVHPLAVLSAYILAKIKKAKFIFEVRDLWPQALIDLGNYKKNNLFIVLMRLLEKSFYKRAEKIITLLPKADEYIAKLGISREKIVWIPNGIDLKRLRERANANVTDDHFTLMYTGAHGKANSLDVILDAASIIQEKSIKEIKIKFMGDGPEKENLIKKAHKMKLKIVQFCDPVPKKRIPEIMQEASGFIFCLADSSLLKYGISSNKLWDYMVSGKPVIFSCNSINNPVAEAGAGITKPPDDPKALAEAIIKLYNMPEKERETMGKRGREYVEKFHTIEKLSVKFLEAIS